MSYAVNFSLEAVEEIMRITMASPAKAAVINASKQLQEALKENPADAGMHLSEGLYYIDCEPLRAFYAISADERLVEVVNVKPI
ncbi:hypothetical protein NA78x_001515 [Anatilimnocola sp. NA78]|uniref:hypothetical protein n=1 Tax=Anatilimnocola sp. NA78 TaxID=3415683 RepID=UPI003CE5C0AF